MARINLAADFRDFLRLCLHHEVEFMVVGGYAVVHYSRPRYTGDLDVWVSSSQENAERIVRVLQDFGFKREDVSTSLITTEGQIVRMGFEPMRLGLFTRIDGVEFGECYPSRVFVRIDDMEVPFIGLDDLRTNKKASGRLKDLQDLEEL